MPLPALPASRRCHAVLAAVLGAVVVALDASAPSPPGAVVPDPIKCWWRSQQTAVHLGEHFGLVLTCGILQTAFATTVPDWKQLDPGAIQLTPFEVLGATRARDLGAGSWRYFQFEYTVRLLDSSAFGQDVDIPSLALTYNVEVTHGTATERGRDQQYLLPPLPIRITSLVPKNAWDIREPPSETFADLEARRFRATSELVAAVVFFTMAVLLTALAMVAAVRRYRGGRVSVLPRLTPVALIRQCLNSVARLEWEVARDGWTSALAERALSVFRIAGAVALGKPVAQVVVTKGTAPREGQLIFRKGLLFGRTYVAASSRITPSAITRKIAALGGAASHARERAMLERVRDALITFNAPCYGRETPLDAGALSHALQGGTDGLRRLSRFPLRPRRQTGVSMKWVAAVGETVWSR